MIGWKFVHFNCKEKVLKEPHDMQQRSRHNKSNIGRIDNHCKGREARLAYFAAYDKNMLRSRSSFSQFCASGWRQLDCRVLRANSRTNRKPIFCATCALELSYEGWTKFLFVIKIGGGWWTQGVNQLPRTHKVGKVCVAQIIVFSRTMAQSISLQICESVRFLFGGKTQANGLAGWMSNGLAGKPKSWLVSQVSPLYICRRGRFQIDWEVAVLALDYIVSSLCLPSMLQGAACIWNSIVFNMSCCSNMQAFLEG